MFATKVLANHQPRLGLASAGLVPDPVPASRLGTQGASTRTLGSVYFFQGQRQLFTSANTSRDGENTRQALWN